MNFIFLLLASSLSFGYIPEYSLITTRTADNHGRGAYLVEQDVTYRKDSESFTVKETWLINSETSMRVTLEGRGPLKGLVQGSMVYESSLKYFIDPGLGARQQRLGDEWLEPLFHFRNPKFIRTRLVNLKIAPPDSLHDRPPLSSDSEVKYDAPSYVRLARVGGAVTWAVGAAPTASGVKPALWIEQDQFVVRKYRGPSQVVIRADDYGKFDEGLWFPRQRIYNFGNFTVTVQTLQVKSLGKLRPDDPRFKASGLSAARDGLKLPDADVLKEFYSRFR